MKPLSSSSPQPQPIRVPVPRPLPMQLPIVQAPMAGVTTPELAAAVSNAGALGSLGVGGADPARAADQIRRTRQLTDRPFNVNFFTHAAPRQDAEVTRAWLRLLEPEFAALGARPPTTLRPVSASAATSDDNTQRLVDVLVDERPAVVSFHFGLPAPGVIDQLHKAGIQVFVTATTVDEALLIQRSGADAVVAQGVEAGGHRGGFDPPRRLPSGSAASAAPTTISHPKADLSMTDLVSAVVAVVNLPVIAAGGIMNGADIAQTLRAGASAAQLGTAFLLCPEAATGPAHRTRIREVMGEPGAVSAPTAFTSAVSGRPARGLRNRMHDLGALAAQQGIRIPDYPLTYDAGKALATAAAAHGDPYSYGAHWAGDQVTRAREMSAGDLVCTLTQELVHAGESQGSHGREGYRRR